MLSQTPVAEKHWGAAVGGDAEMGAHRRAALMGGDLGGLPDLARPGSAGLNSSAAARRLPPR